MRTTTARIAVEAQDPGKLIGRLAKHWAHKLKVESSPTHARIEFGASRLHLQASERAVAETLEVDAADDERRLQEVVSSHLERMSIGEELKIEWRSPQG